MATLITPIGLPEEFESVKLSLLAQVAQAHHLDVAILHDNITAPWGWLALCNLASEGLVVFLGRLVVITDDGQLWADEMARAAGPTPPGVDSPDRRDAHRAQLRRALADPEYRALWVEEGVYTGIPVQLREMRRRRGWSQMDAANHLGVSQGAYAKFERDEDRKHYQTDTLLKIARLHDVALMVRFCSFAEHIDHSSDLPALAPPSYAEDPDLHP